MGRARRRAAAPGRARPRRHRVDGRAAGCSRVTRPKRSRVYRQLESRTPATPRFGGEDRRAGAATSAPDARGAAEPARPEPPPIPCSKPRPVRAGVPPRRLRGAAPRRRSPAAAEPARADGGRPAPSGAPTRPAARQPLAQLGVRRRVDADAAGRPGGRRRRPAAASRSTSSSARRGSLDRPAPAAGARLQERRSRPVPRLAAEPQALNADQRPERPQPEPAGAAGAGGLRPHDAGEIEAHGAGGGPRARRRDRLVPDQPRRRAGRRGAGPQGAGGRRAHQRGRAHALEPGAARRAPGGAGSLRRAAPLEHLRPGAGAPAFDDRGPGAGDGDRVRRRRAISWPCRRWWAVCVPPDRAERAPGGAAGRAGGGGAGRAARHPSPQHPLPHRLHGLGGACSLVRPEATTLVTDFRYAVQAPDEAGSAAVVEIDQKSVWDRLGRLLATAAPVRSASRRRRSPCGMPSGSAGLTRGTGGADERPGRATPGDQVAGGSGRHPRRGRPGAGGAGARCCPAVRAGPARARDRGRARGRAPAARQRVAPVSHDRGERAAGGAAPRAHQPADGAGGRMAAA